MDSLEELYHIWITAGDTVLSGVLYDTQTSNGNAVGILLWMAESMEYISDD